MRVEDWLGQENTLGIDIYNKKYRYNDETFEQFLDRISGGNEEIRELIKKKKFLFGGRILANRGIKEKKTYSNCYVLESPKDNLESIFETSGKLARTFSYGGGVGIDLGNLAPKNAAVNNTAKKSTGAVSFMDLYNLTTGLIGQNGRRGALMLTMPIDHPDIEDFINSKNEQGNLTNCNISVKVSDEFMNSVIRDECYELKFTRPETGETISKIVAAKDLFNSLCESNWKTAEPGVLFWDEVCRHNHLCNTEEFTFENVNPCGELPLPAGGSCLLGALNLSEFVRKPFTKDATFDTESFLRAVKTAVKALNEVLDEGLELHPLQEQRDSVRKWRQIGLGIMGVSDMLIKLGVRYGSSYSYDLCKSIAFVMYRTALMESDNIGGTLGAYEGYNANTVNSTSMIQKTGHLTQHLRNSQLLTVAPTGTISTMFGVSGGIEPIFAKDYTRTTKSLHGKDKTYTLNTPVIQELMDEKGITNDELPDYVVTAHEIDPVDRIRFQAAWQKWIDASISSTINLPNHATVEEIKEIYLLAWKHQLKGVTIYRDGCEREGILNTDNEVEKKSNKNIGLEKHLVTGCGSLHVCAFFDEHGGLKNTYLSKGSTGGCNNYMIGLSRIMSLAARNGCNLDSIVDQLNSCGVCPSYAVRRATKGDVSKGSCCPVAIGKALKEMQNEVIGNVSREETVNNQPKCPECGSRLVFEGGCNTCKNCGWSKCN